MEYHWWLSETILEPYVIGEKVFNDEEIQKIIKIGKNEKFSTFEEPLINGKEKDISTRNCFLSFLRSDIDDNKWIFRRITDYIVNINEQFYNYNIEYIENLQFTEYKSPGHFYGKHVDLQYKSSKTRKISFSIQLSDDNEYEGGDLEINVGGSILTVPKEKGLICFFPSFLLHRVVPVTSGVRKSLVTWLCGANLR
jgi:PKHD-type hydroxylase